MGDCAEVGVIVKTKAAVLWELNAPWSIEEIDLDPPGPNEVLVKLVASGMCHSDEHLVTGDMVPPKELLAMMGVDDFFPFIGGHEGAGVVVKCGPGVTSLQPGDHVSASFVPSCGRCRYCSTGRQNLCNLGAGTLTGGMITDGTHRHHVKDGRPVKLMAKLGTFSEYATVAEASLIKVEKDLPLDAVALVSCGVATGWGSATNRADTQPGDTVVVVGIGGIALTFVSGMPSMTRTRFATPTVGREKLIGEIGPAVSDISPEGSVKILGARWKARTNRATPIKSGENARVVAIDGVVLEVEPESGGARDYRERRSKSDDAVH